VRRFFLLGLLALATSLPVPGAERASLAALRTGHPRLLVRGAADFAQIKAAAETDPLRARLLARIVKEAEAILLLGPIEHKLIGPRLLDQSRAAVRRVLTCATAFRLTGETRFAAQAKRDMLTAAAFPDWNPSHFLDVAEMSFALALGYDWLYDQLTAAERAKIRAALLEKSLELGVIAYTPGPEKDSRFNFVSKHSNWNQVCNGGLIAAALALADETPALAQQILDGALQSIPAGLHGYAPDGAYPEGPGYWAYGTMYTVLTVAMLESALGSDFGITRQPGLDRTAQYLAHMRGPTGLAFNYADGVPRLGATAAFTWLAQRFPAAELPPLARDAVAEMLGPDESRSVRERFFALHCLWFPGSAPSNGPALPRDAHFRGPADVAVLRSAWNDSRALFVAFKAGSNAVNHAHLDLGSFVLEADDVRWAVDLGRDDYNLPGYFGDQRWSYFRLNNFSHNTLGPDGALQPATALAPIVQFASDEQRAFAVADLSAIYHEPGVTAKRAVALLDRARVLVQDDVRGLSQPTALRWSMLSGAKIQLSENGRTATLQQDSRTLRVDLLAPAGARFAIRPATPPTTEENQNTGLQLLTIPWTAPAGRAQLAVLLTPVGERWPTLPAPGLLTLD
jgi:hypothetical protein